MGVVTLTKDAFRRLKEKRAERKRNDQAAAFFAELAEREWMDAGKVARQAAKHADEAAELAEKVREADKTAKRAEKEAKETAALAKKEWMALQTVHERRKNDSSMNCLTCFCVPCKRQYSPHPVHARCMTVVEVTSTDHSPVDYQAALEYLEGAETRRIYAKMNAELLPWATSADAQVDRPALIVTKVLEGGPMEGKVSAGMLLTSFNDAKRRKR